MSLSLPTGSESTVDSTKPQLLSKIDNGNDRVIAVISVPREDGIIGICDDKSVRLWLKRESGQYWPSICHSLPAVPTCIDYNQQTSRLFIGFESGLIVEFKIADDCNSIRHIRDISAHSAAVTSVVFSLSCEWLLSCGKDKHFVCHCSETGRRLANYQCDASCTSVAFDAAAQFAFVGDFAGSISVISMKDGGCTHVKKLAAHAQSVRCLAWDAERQQLFSGSFDQCVIDWDIGGKRGIAYDLSGHKSKIVGVAYATGKRRLISASDDGQIAFWDMNARRDETPQWAEKDNCERCESPFFWNVKEMWTRKVVGMRQHHCRMCGKAVCDKCSNHTSLIPNMGYEYPVRICDGCSANLEGKQLTPLCQFFNVKQPISAIDLNETHGRLLTVGSDRVIKIWDISKIIL